MRGVPFRLNAALGAQRQCKQLVAKVDAQAAECAVAVGFDSGKAQAQVAGNALLRHALQQAGAHVQLALGQPWVGAQQAFAQRRQAVGQCGHVACAGGCSAGCSTPGRCARAMCLRVSASSTGAMPSKSLICRS